MVLAAEQSTGQRRMIVLRRGRRDRLRIYRVPDGEPGGRANWVLTQEPVFSGNTGLATVPGPDGRERYVLAEGATPATLRFDRFDYADHARSSFPITRRSSRPPRVPPTGSPRTSS